jgi:hypothetical protein
MVGLQQPQRTQGEGGLRRAPAGNSSLDYAQVLRQKTLFPAEMEKLAAIRALIAATRRLLPQTLPGESRNVPRRAGATSNAPAARLCRPK